MQTEKVTIHKIYLTNGAQIRYARILHKCGRTFVGQSVLLRRLSSKQRRYAIQVDIES